MRVWILFLIVASACGDDSVTPTMDAGRADSGARDAGRRDAGGGVDAGSGGDMNDSFAEAVEVPLGNTGVMGVINPAGDHDFYRFDVAAGDWLVVDTEANTMDNPMMIDTVVTLYDSTMTQVAENDDAVPRVNTDSEIIYHALTAGTYYVEVQEFSDWDGDPESAPEGMPSYTYTLRAFVLDTSAAPFSEDPEMGNDETTAAALAFNMAGSNFLVGTFTGVDDVDVFSFTVGGVGDQLASFEIMPAGTDGYGSTTTAGDFWVTNMAGDILVRLDNREMGLVDLSPSLAPGNYFLWVEHGGTAGTNDFYVFKNFIGAENPPETSEPMNDTLMGAQMLEQTRGEDGVNTAFILSHLASDTDVDYYSFEVADMERVAAVCGSATSGSGVQGLRMEIRDDMDTVVMMSTESPPNTALLQNVMVDAPGTYYLRVSKTGQDPMIPADFVRCAVRASVPMMP
jgi:hypothetical protein